MLCDDVLLGEGGEHLLEPTDLALERVVGGIGGGEVPLRPMVSRRATAWTAGSSRKTPSDPFSRWALRRSTSASPAAMALRISLSMRGLSLRKMAATSASNARLPSSWASAASSVVVDSTGGGGGGSTADSTGKSRSIASNSSLLRIGLET